MIKVYPNAITSEQSKYLIDISQDKLEQVGTIDFDTDYRVAKGTWLPDDLPISREIKKIISDYTNLPTENMEDVHIVKYEIGGLYEEHHDFFPIDSLFERENREGDWMVKGGQRIKTALIYLNDDFEGGNTVFLNMGKIIKPEKNKMVIWDNVLEDGSPDEQSLHAGDSVTSGHKYICIVWIREEKFRH